jgi:Ca2+-binding EF-hand superfamily protein
MPHPATMRVAGSDGELHISSQLKGRQDKLTRLHMEHNSKQLQRVGEASIYGPPGLRTSGLVAHPFKRLQSSTDMAFSLEAPPPTPPMIVDGVAMDIIIEGLRRRMHQKGLDCLMGLEKFYNSLDDNGNGKLEFAEFKDGMLRQDVLNSDAACRAIFDYFDTDKSGYMDYIEFLSAVKGKLNDARKAVVDEAFDLLDADGSGILEAADLKKRYRTFAHPDVRAGVRSEDEVYNEFLDHFDTVAGDRAVSKVEFEKYYESMSAVIHNDKLFEAMIRNTWHLPGAQSGHCLRVHITRAAGHEMEDPQSWGHDIQKTVEIRPDIGFQRHDPRFYEECNERLKDMGFPDVCAIEVLGRY